MATDFEIVLSSFGFKHGPPVEADCVFDARVLHNPFWVAELRPHDGRQKDVQEYVFTDPGAEEFVSGIQAEISRYMDDFSARDKHLLRVAVGCTGGRHRSVAVVEALATRYQAEPVKVHVNHRDVEIPDPR